MKYRIVLLVNGKYKKTLYKCNTKEGIFMKFNNMVRENNVFFPKKYINTLKIKPVKYKICVTKITEEGDTFRILRDKYGKLYTEKPLGDWTILHSSKYEIEETFWVYGMDKKRNRPTIATIIKLLFKGSYSKKMVKQVIVVQNKLVIYDETNFDMVICKNIYDAQRLHHTLAKAAKKQKIKNIIFAGTALYDNSRKVYDLIEEKTGWSYSKVMRTTTRP